MTNIRTWFRRHQARAALQKVVRLTIPGARIKVETWGGQSGTDPIDFRVKY